MVHPLFGADFEGWGKATLCDDYTMEPVLSDTHTHTEPHGTLFTTHVSQSSLGNLVGGASSGAKNNVGSTPVSTEGCSLLAKKLECFS